MNIDPYPEVKHEAPMEFRRLAMLCTKEVRQRAIRARYERYVKLALYTDVMELTYAFRTTRSQITKISSTRSRISNSVFQPEAVLHK